LPFFATNFLPLWATLPNDMCEALATADHPVFPVRFASLRQLHAEIGVWVFLPMQDTHTGWTTHLDWIVLAHLHGPSLCCPHSTPLLAFSCC
jgi:hypothetical protein